MNTRYLLLLMLLPAVLVAGALGPASAQSAAFDEVVDVTLVNLDVLVADRQGQPVLGLTAADFEVTDGGTPVVITHFAPPSSRRATLSAQLPDAEAPGMPEPAGSEEPPREPLQLVVFLDNVNTRPQNRARVMNQLRDFLTHRLEPDDRVLVASFDGAVTVQQAFTTDRDRVEIALAKVEKLPARGLEVDVDRRSGLEAMQSIMLEEGVENRAACSALFEEAVNAYVQGAKQRIGATVASLEAFLGALGGLHGRKTLIWVTDGLEIRPPSSMIEAASSACGDSSLSVRVQRFDHSETLRRLAAAANASRTTFYPLDAAGPAFRDHQVEQESMSLVAQETGGKAMLNAGDALPALAAVSAEAGSFYSLAYSPPRGTEAEEVRRIRVKVSQAGLDVRYRRSHKIRSEDDLLRERLLAALWLDAGDNPLDLRLEARGEPQATLDGVKVDLLLGIPIGKLTFLPGEGGVRQGRFTVHVTHLAADGSSPALQSETKTLSIPPRRFAEAEKQLFGYRIGLVLPPGENQVAVAVRDEVGRTLSFITRREMVQKP